MNAAGMASMMADSTSPEPEDGNPTALASWQTFSATVGMDWPTASSDDGLVTNDLLPEKSYLNLFTSDVGVLSAGIQGGTPGVTYFYLVMLIATTIIGNVGNVMVIGAVLSDRRLRKEGNIFILNLAFADLCVTGFVGPFSIVGVFIGNGFWKVHNGLCHVIGSVCLISCVCSLWSIASIAVNRYILLCRQSLYHKIYTLKKTIGICIGLWFCALLLDLPNFLGWGDHAYDMKTMACSYDRTASYSYTLFFMTMFVIIPLITVLYCNVQIFLVYARSQSRVAAHGRTKVWTVEGSSMVTGRAEYSYVDDDATTGYQTSHGTENQGCTETKNDQGNKTGLQLLQVPKNHGSSPRAEGGNPQLPADPHVATSTKKKRKRAGYSFSKEMKLAKTLFIVFIAFCICWTPYALLCLIDFGDQISGDTYSIAILMAHSSSSLNSVLYAVTNKGFRDGYRVFLKKMKIDIK